MLYAYSVYSTWKEFYWRRRKLSINNYAKDQSSKLTAVIEKCILILYIVYLVALVVINIVKCGKTVKCFRYYAWHLWPKRHTFFLPFSPIEQMVHYWAMVPHLKPSQILGLKFFLALSLGSVIITLALLKHWILDIWERKATRFHI